MKIFLFRTEAIFFSLLCLFLVTPKTQHQNIPRRRHGITSMCTVAIKFVAEVSTVDAYGLRMMVSKEMC